MTTETMKDTKSTVADSIRGAQDALSVRRVFGAAYELPDMTVIPVARVAGGGGGGGEATTDEESGDGFGSGFGLGASPVGVYQVHDGSVEWKPSVDINRLVRGGQVLTGIIAVCVTLVLLRRR